MSKRRITISLDPEAYSALTTVAEVTDRSLSWLASQAIKEFLERQDAFKQKPIDFSWRQ